MIVFGCNPGFVPAGNMIAVCTSDGRWNPNPAEVRCTGKSAHSRDDNLDV